MRYFVKFLYCNPFKFTFHQVPIINLHKTQTHQVGSAYHYQTQFLTFYQVNRHQQKYNHTQFSTHYIHTEIFGCILEKQRYQNIFLFQRLNLLYVKSQ